MDSVDDQYFVGVDGGGSGCRVAICDRTGRRVGEALGGPANFTTDPDQALQNVAACLEQAAQNAGLTAHQLGDCAAHVGLAGVLTPSDIAAVCEAVPMRQVGASDDRATSLIGALGASDGALLAIGTGSFVAVRCGDETRFIGGWGAQVGDQASGAWLGRAALTLWFLVHDGLEPESALTQEIGTQFGGAVEIVSFAKAGDPAAYAGLAPMIVTAAQSGDPHACALMQRGADYLTRCLCAANLSPEAIVCLAGGIGRFYEPYLDAETRARLHPPAGSALDGALQLARRKLENRKGSL